MDLITRPRKTFVLSGEPPTMYHFTVVPNNPSDSPPLLLHRTVHVPAMCSDCTVYSLGNVDDADTAVVVVTPLSLSFLAVVSCRVSQSRSFSALQHFAPPPGQDWKLQKFFVSSSETSDRHKHHNNHPDPRAASPSPQPWMRRGRTPRTPPPDSDAGRCGVPLCALRDVSETLLLHFSLL